MAEPIAPDHVCPVCGAEWKSEHVFTIGDRTWRLPTTRLRLIEGDPGQAQCPDCEHTWTLDHPVIHPTAEELQAAKAAPALEGIEGIVHCEGCSALLDDETCHHDIEGVPLCDGCWAALVAEADEAARRLGRPGDCGGQTNG